MCLVLSWKTGLKAICSVAWLSHIRFIALTSPNLSCWSNCLSHVSSQVAAAIARYSASAPDHATLFCFLLRHEIKFPPMRTQYPEVDLLSAGEPAQSASE